MERCTLTVDIIEAKDLRGADIGGKSDPYVKIKHVHGLHKGAQTKTIKKTLNPVWKETFTLFFYHTCRELCFKIYDHDKISKDDLLGKSYYPIAALMDGTEKDLWLPVRYKGSQKGELHIKLKVQWVFPLCVVGQWHPTKGDNVYIGMGWDMKKKKKIDLDASVIALSPENTPICTVSFKNLQGLEGAIQHLGDNKTGEGKGDDEQILLDLPKLPPACTKIVIVITSFNGQPLNEAKSAYIRLFGEEGTMAFYRIQTMLDSTAMLFGVLMKNPAVNQWFLQVFAQPLNGTTVDQTLPAAVGLLNACHF
jgi:tellurium resistance protein TerZ